jgi:hypothetical protein
MQMSLSKDENYSHKDHWDIEGDTVEERLKNYLENFWKSFEHTIDMSPWGVERTAQQVMLLQLRTAVLEGKKIKRCSHCNQPIYLSDEKNKEWIHLYTREEKCDVKASPKKR